MWDKESGDWQSRQQITQGVGGKRVREKRLQLTTALPHDWELHRHQAIRKGDWIGTGTVNNPQRVDYVFQFLFKTRQVTLRVKYIRNRRDEQLLIRESKRLIPIPPKESKWIRVVLWAEAECQFGLNNPIHPPSPLASVWLFEEDLVENLD